MSQNLSSAAVAAAALCESNESPSLTFGCADSSEHSCLHMQYVSQFHELSSFFFIPMTFITSVF